MKFTPLLTSWLLATTLATQAAETLTVVRDGDGLVVREGDEELTRYHPGRTPYIYPLPSPSGANLARNWPIQKGIEGEDTDHPHHVSLWLAHGDVNGFDFWSWRGEGEPRIDTVAFDGLEAGEGTAGFAVDLAWIANDVTQLSESRRYEFSRPDAKTLIVEVTSELRAETGDVLFGDTKEGTFAVRVDRTMRHKGPMAQGDILNSEGVTGSDCWGKRARWVAFHGPDEKGEPAVIALMDHPSNLRHPTWWHARDYGLLAANPFGIHDFEDDAEAGAGDHRLAQDETLTQRYQVVILHGTIDADRLSQLWNTFSQ